MARNVNVMALTITAREMPGLAKRKRVQYHMRRMWATLLLYDIQFVQGWSWERIHQETGRTKQAWFRVTQGDVPDKLYFDTRYRVDAASHEERRKMDVAVPKVTDSFIHTVTMGLSKLGNFETWQFSRLFLMGMAEPPRGDWMVNTDAFNEEDANARLMLWNLWMDQCGGDNYGVGCHFAVFRPTRSESGRARHIDDCTRHVKAFERATAGWEDRPAEDRRITDGRLDEMKRQTVWRGVDEQRAVGTQADAIELKPATADVPNDLGMQRVDMPFDVHPSMIKDGEVRFEVVITYNAQGVKTGHAIKHVPG